MADWIPIGLRALGFVAALQAAGGAIFLRLFGADLERSAAAVHSIAKGTAIMAILLTLAHQFVAPARLTGDVSGIFDGSLQRFLLASDMGAATSVRVLGLVMVAAGIARGDRSAGFVAVTGSVLVVASFMLMGHTAAAEARWLLAPVLFLHLLVVAFWFGALAPLNVATRLEPGTAAADVVRQFSRLAVLCVPLILIAGLVMAVVLLPDLDALGSPYGLLLLTKLAGFALLMALASLNKWRLGPRVGVDAAGGRRFRLSLSIEWIVIAAVLALTAAMTSLYSPEH